MKSETQYKSYGIQNFSSMKSKIELDAEGLTYADFALFWILPSVS